jgi:Na+-transporting NADH:ubiquinone oxidoreductase subunit B
LKALQDQIHKFAHHFEKGGKLEKLYPLYEANDTFLFTPGEVTHGTAHVRDALDTKRMMSMVIVALLPCIFMALYNTGYQAQVVLKSMADFEMPSWWNGGWRYSVLNWLGVDYKNPGSGFMDFGRILPCMIHGALYFLPVYIVTMAVGGLCEVIFSVIRKHEINEGFLVTGMLFPLTLVCFRKMKSPCSTSPTWCAGSVVEVR